MRFSKMMRAARRSELRLRRSKKPPFVEAIEPRVLLSANVYNVNDPSRDTLDQHSQFESSNIVFDPAGSDVAHVVVADTDAVESQYDTVTTQHRTGFANSSNGGINFVGPPANQPFLPNGANGFGDGGNSVVAWDNTNQKVWLATLANYGNSDPNHNSPSADIQVFTSTDFGAGA